MGKNLKFVAVSASILIALAGVSQASAVPSFAGKPTDPGKPVSTPGKAPGNLTVTSDSNVNGAPITTGKPSAPGQSAQGDAPGQSGNSNRPADAGKPAITGLLLAATKKSEDALDLGPKTDYIVRFNESADVGNEVSALKAAKVAVGRTYGHIFKGLVASMTAKQVTNLKKRSTVASVEADAIIEIATSELNATWGIDRIDQASSLSGTYDYTNTGLNLTTGVATKAFVIDTGIRADHTDFGGRVAAGFTAVSDGNGTSDCNGHGTHVAGTIGGEKYGVAKAVTLVPVRVLGCTGSGTTSGVIAGLDYVAKNYVAGTPAVANLSLGGSGISSTLDTAINNLINRGVTVVVAAGNSTADACTSSPAHVANAITVAASDSTDKFATFSNFGTCVDLVAPGVGITSDWYTSTTATNTISGTSMATPHVTGVVALILSTGYRLPTDVAALLLSAATKNAILAIPAETVNNLLYSPEGGWAAGTSVIPTTPTGKAPDAATGVSATALSRSAAVAWTPGADNGSPLTGQTVKVWSGTTLVGTVSVSASAKSVTIKGLRGGVSYSFSVVETNAFGSSADSLPSKPITVLK